MKVFCCKYGKAEESYLSENNLNFQKAYKCVDKQLDIVQLLNTIQKLKSLGQALMGNDEKLILKTQEIYLNMTTLNKYDDNETKFEQFWKMENRNEIVNQVIQANLNNNLKGLFSDSIDKQNKFSFQLPKSMKESGTFQTEDNSADMV